MSVKIKKTRPLIDRILALPWHWQMLVVIGLFLFFGAIGFLFLNFFHGSEAINIEAEKELSPFWVTLLSMIDPGHMLLAVQSGEPLLKATIPFLTLTGLTLLGGFFMASLVGVRDDRARLAREGKKRYHLKKGHVVLLGWDETAPGIIKRICMGSKNMVPYIVTLSLIETGKICEDLVAAEVQQSYNLFFYNGNYGDKKELEALDLMHASRLYILGDMDDTSRDSKNLEAVLNVLEILNGQRKEALPCFMHINDPYIYSTFQKIGFFRRGDWNYLNVRPFNFFECWGQRLWSSISCCDVNTPNYQPLAYQPEKFAKGADVHLVIVGFGQMGRGLALEAARICHYGNGHVSRITVIDKNFAQIEEQFSSYFSIEFAKIGQNGSTDFGVKNKSLHDVEFYALEKSIESREARDFLIRLVADDSQIPTIAICFSDIDTALLSALSLPLEVKKAGVPILIRQQGHSGLRNLTERLNQSESNEAIKLWKGFKFFGGLDEYSIDEECNEKLAQVLNAIYIVYDIKAKMDGGKESADLTLLEEYLRKISKDPSLRKYPGLDDFYWNEQNVNFRWSSRYQSAALFERLRGLGFDLTLEKAGLQNTTGFFLFEEGYENKGAKELILKWHAELEKAIEAAKEKSADYDYERMAEAEHDRWWAERVLAGWKYAGVTSKPTLKHSDMKIYSELEEEIKGIDRRVALLSPWMLSTFLGVSLSKRC